MGKILNQINDILQSEVIFPFVSTLLSVVLSNVVFLSVNIVAEYSASVNSVQSLSTLSVSYFISSISGGVLRPLFINSNASILACSPPIPPYSRSPCNTLEQGSGRHYSNQSLLSLLSFSCSPRSRSIGGWKRNKAIISQSHRDCIFVANKQSVIRMPLGIPQILLIQIINLKWKFKVSTLKFKILQVHYNYLNQTIYNFSKLNHKGKL